MLTDAQVPPQTFNPADLADPDQQRKTAENVLQQLGLHPNQSGARNLLDLHFQGPTADPEVAATVAPLIHNTDQPTTPVAPPQQVKPALPVTPGPAHVAQPSATTETPQSTEPGQGSALINPGSPSIPSPSSAQRIMGNTNQGTEQAQNELERLIHTGAGVTQIKNPFLRGLATVGDVVGGSLFPSIERNIPGTFGHHGQLIENQQNLIKSDLGNAEEEARTAQTQQATKTQADEPINKPNELAVWQKQNPDRPIKDYWEEKARAQGSKKTPQELAMEYYMTPKDQGGPGLTADEALRRSSADIQSAKPMTPGTEEVNFQKTLSKVMQDGNMNPAVMTDPKALSQAITNSPNLTPEEKSGALSYITTKTTPASQAELAKLRTQGLLQRGLTPAIDRTSGMLTLITAKDNIDNPGRYIPAAQGGTSMTREAAFNELGRVSSMTRDAITNLKTPFTTEQRAKMALALKSPDPDKAWSNFFHSEVGASLTDDQIDYATSIASLDENAMALRSVQGLGQGSDQLRGAIHAMLPGAGTPNAKTALRQMDVFDALVGTLKGGVPKSGVAQPKLPPAPKTGAHEKPQENQNNTTSPSGGKTFTKAQVQAAADAHHMSYEDAKADAIRQGHKVDEGAK